MIRRLLFLSFSPPPFFFLIESRRIGRIGVKYNELKGRARGENERRETIVTAPLDETVHGTRNRVNLRK